MPFESTVHVIDDDEALRDSLTFLLRTARLDVQSYPSARPSSRRCPKRT
jgi:FixJ family two-component response regulator